MTNKTTNKSSKGKKDDGTEKKTRRVKTPDLLRGFKDIMPDDQKYWHWIRRVTHEMSRDYSFNRIDTPILESTDLFIRSVGKQTDIVEKEMFSFEDKGGERVSLRPEATAAVVRAYIGHGMVNLPQPVKLFYIGPMFRYGRPQAGRQRQFWQFGFESLGSDDPIVDAQLIFLTYTFFKELGLDITIDVNSIGTVDSRQQYKIELVSYFRSKRTKLCDDCKRRLSKSPLRLLDCKEEGCRQVREEAPQLLDWLDDKSKNHFMKVLEYLDESQVKYELNPYLVRGLDYYSRTVFEIIPALEKKDDEEEEDGPQKSQNALGGGGRYDGLADQIGGRETPGCGFSIGIERVVNLLKQKNIEPPDERKVEVMFAQLGEAARRRGLTLFEELRKSGIAIIESFGKSSLKSQLDLANKIDIKYTLILGQKEVMDETIIIRDMDSGSQEIVDIKKVIAELKKKLSL